MSFGIHFQRFLNGDADLGGGEQMRRTLEPYVVHEEPQQKFVGIEYGDGSADVYLDHGGMMANRISGDLPWELLVKGGT